MTNGRGLMIRRERRRPIDKEDRSLSSSSRWTFRDARGGGRAARILLLLAIWTTAGCAETPGRLSALEAKEARRRAEAMQTFRSGFRRDLDVFLRKTNESVHEAREAYASAMAAAENFRERGTVPEKDVREIERRAENTFERARNDILRSIYREQKRADELDEDAARRKARAESDVADAVSRAANATARRLSVETRKRSEAKKAAEAREQFRKQDEHERMLDQMLRKFAHAIDAQEAERLASAPLSWDAYFARGV